MRAHALVTYAKHDTMATITGDGPDLGVFPSNKRGGFVSSRPSVGS